MIFDKNFYLSFGELFSTSSASPRIIENSSWNFDIIRILDMIGHGNVKLRGANDISKTFAFFNSKQVLSQ